MWECVGMTPLISKLSTKGGEWSPLHPIYFMPGMHWVWGWWLPEPSGHSGEEKNISPAGNYSFWVLQHVMSSLCQVCSSGLGEAEAVGVKCVAVPLCPSQFAHGLCWNHSWGGAVHGQPWHSLLGLGTFCSTVVCVVGKLLLT
jgi:hypothetical protein